MNIIHRLVTSSKEIVFESEYGNKIHFQLGDPWNRNGDTKYWIELPPQVELKYRVWAQQRYPGNDFAEDFHLDRFRDPNKTHSFGEVLGLFWDKNTPDFPWTPCKEDQPMVLDYLKENFEKIPRFYDARKLREYAYANPGEWVTPKYPLVIQTRKVIDKENVWIYDTYETDFRDFVADMDGSKVGIFLSARYGLELMKRVPLNVAKYLLSKAE